VTRDIAAFKRLVRTAVLGFLQDAAARDWDAARLRCAALGDPPASMTLETAALAESRRIEKAFTAYFDARGRFRLDPEGRSALNTHIAEQEAMSGEPGKTWSVAQVLIDPEGLNDWEARFTLSLAESRTASEPVLRFDSVSAIGT